MQTVTFECPEEDVAVLDVLASVEDLKRADILRRAVRQLVRSGASRKRSTGRLSSISDGDGTSDVGPRRRRKVAA